MRDRQRHRDVGERQTEKMSEAGMWERDRYTEGHRDVGV